MPRLKLGNISPGPAVAPPGEEFFRLPRAEFLLKKANRAPSTDIEKMVVNERLKICNRFSMAVADNRMSDAGIKKDDFVVIEKHKNYNSGEILAVKLGEKIFIRRYFRTANHIRLECNTPSRQTMILDADTPGLCILGTIIQVIREI